MQCCKVIQVAILVSLIAAAVEIWFPAPEIYFVAHPSDTSLGRRPKVQIQLGMKGAGTVFVAKVAWVYQGTELRTQLKDALASSRFRITSEPLLYFASFPHSLTESSGRLVLVTFRPPMDYMGDEKWCQDLRATLAEEGGRGLAVRLTYSLLPTMPKGLSWTRDFPLSKSKA